MRPPRKFKRRAKPAGAEGIGAERPRRRRAGAAPRAYALEICLRRAPTAARFYNAARTRARRRFLRGESKSKRARYKIKIEDFARGIKIGAERAQ